MFATYKKFANANRIGGAQQAKAVNRKGDGDSRNKDMEEVLAKEAAMLVKEAAILADSMAEKECHCK